MGNKLHGYTRITLRNPISGNILKDVESENTFQGGVIAQYLRTLGTNNGIMEDAETKRNPLWQKIVGGLFLFQNTETAGNMYMTAGNRMIGNACYGVANATNPPELGSYNSNESSASASAITQVYDFATNQANGTIGCVCLTSQVGGFMGYGNASKKSYDASSIWQWSYPSYQNSLAADPVNAPDGKLYGVIGNMNYQFGYDSTNHKLIVKKSKVPMAKASVFDWIIDTVEIDVSSIYSEMGNSQPQILCASGGKFYMFKNYTDWIASGATYKYWVYDPSDDSITSKTFTNSSSHSVSTSCVSVAHGILAFMSNTEYHISLFDETNGTHIGDIKAAEDDFPTGYGMGNEVSFGEMPQGLINTTFKFFNLADTRRAAQAIYDPVNDTLLPCNGQPFFPSNTAPPNYYDLVTNAMCLRGRYFTYKYNNPLYLATINNLNSPVTKTSAQTMKVTYTLTEA